MARELNYPLAASFIGWPNRFSRHFGRSAAKLAARTGPLCLRASLVASGVPLARRLWPCRCATFCQYFPTLLAPLANQCSLSRWCTKCDQVRPTLSPSWPLKCLRHSSSSFFEPPAQNRPETRSLPHGRSSSWLTHFLFTLFLLSPFLSAVQNARLLPTG